MASLRAGEQESSQAGATTAELIERVKSGRSDNGCVVSALKLNGTIEEPEVRARPVVFDAAARIVQLLAVQEITDLGVVHELQWLGRVAVHLKSAVAHGARRRAGIKGARHIENAR